MNKQIIIFGAGACGKQALKHFGEGQVKCFVDNNPDKAGHKIYGKPIISFDELVDIAHDYMVVIASERLAEMSNQLERSGITDYHYYHPVLEKAFSQIMPEIRNHQTHKLVLYGIDAEGEAFLKRIMQELENRGETRNFSVTDPEKEAENQKQHEQHNDVYVIIGNRQYHDAYFLKAKQQINQNSIVVDPFVRQWGHAYDIIVNSYENVVGQLSEDRWNECIGQNTCTFDAINAYVEAACQGVPLFKHVEIETINRCNGNCSFCPVNKQLDPRPKKVMRRELFDSIIDQLARINYDGTLGLFSNNEPLLDERVVELAQYAKKSLPSATTLMFTNGTLLNIDLFKELIQHIDRLMIDNYGYDGKLIKPCREIADYVEKHESLIEKVTIILRNPKEILTSRGGDAPNRKDMISFGEVKCALPFQQLIIRPDGKVSLCCNDALGRDTMGDLTKETILEVWHGEKYVKVREAIAQGRKHWGHCEYCDTFLID